VTKLPAQVKIAGQKVKLSDLPPAIVERIKASMGRPTLPAIPVPKPDEDLLWVGKLGAWGHRCTQCAGRFIPLGKPVYHSKHCTIK
jgi:hypothetical protein